MTRLNRRRERRTKRSRRLRTRTKQAKQPKQSSYDSHAGSDSSVLISYRANANHRPKMGESNAELTLRHEQIEDDINRMKHEHEMRQSKDHKHHTKKLTNNVTEVNLNTEYYLYNNPDKCLTTQPIPFLYDTGAAISMISSDPSWAWANLRECLYHIGGCFEGPTFKDLMMGGVSWDHYLGFR